MDMDRLKGMGRQLSGSIREAVGKLTGDTKTQAEGAGQKGGGKLQSTIGAVKDSLRRASKA